MGMSSDVFTVKYADDTAIVGLITEDDVEYHRCVDEFVDWSQSSVLQLTPVKLEMIFDFRTGGDTYQHITVNSERIEVVDEYKYLGRVIDAKWTWGANTWAIYKKVLQ